MATKTYDKDAQIEKITKDGESRKKAIDLDVSKQVAPIKLEQQLETVVGVWINNHPKQPLSGIYFDPETTTFSVHLKISEVEHE